MNVSLYYLNVNSTFYKDTENYKKCKENENTMLWKFHF